ncbi:hypothetical protein V6N12_035642 [Hibiscus sabdariffa]|uniref:DUF4283 domain-containing protein n=1 Tax=Hibiscus sabdariffa TaxID=183260 RepID=A0ABR2ENP0_9ROSI
MVEMTVGKIPPRVGELRCTKAIERLNGFCIFEYSISVSIARFKCRNSFWQRKNEGLKQSNVNDEQGGLIQNVERVCVIQESIEASVWKEGVIGSVVGSVDDDKVSILKTSLVGWCVKFFKVEELAKEMYEMKIISFWADCVGINKESLLPNTFARCNLQIVTDHMEKLEGIVELKVGVNIYQVRVSEVEQPTSSMCSCCEIKDIESESMTTVSESTNSITNIGNDVDEVLVAMRAEICNREGRVFVEYEPMVRGEAGEDVDVSAELVVVLNEERVVALFDNDDTTGPEIVGYYQENLMFNCLGDEEVLGVRGDKVPDKNQNFEEEIVNAIRVEEEFMGGILVDPLMDGGEAGEDANVSAELAVVLNEERVVALFDNDDTTGPEIEGYCQENLVTNCLGDEEVLGVRGDNVPDKNQNFKEEIIKTIRIEEEFMGGILVDPSMDRGQLDLDKLPDVWGFIRPNGLDKSSCCLRVLDESSHLGVSFVGQAQPKDK